MLIQKSVCPDSIVVSSLLLVEFCNTIPLKADMLSDSIDVR